MRATGSRFMDARLTSDETNPDGTKITKRDVDRAMPSQASQNPTGQADPSSSTLLEPEPKRLKLDPSATKGKGKGKDEDEDEAGGPKHDALRGKGRPGRGRINNDGGWGKRSKRDMSQAETGVERSIGGQEEGEEPATVRLAKRKVALLISFCGTGCSGMQFQKTGEATIEGYLFDALIKSGAISKDNSDEPSKVGMQRAARTDAGVHAATNLVSLKMITEPPIHDSFQPESLSSSIKAATTDGDTAMQHSVAPSTQRVVAWINSFLPPQIRILSFVRTRGSFHGRKGCDSRRYEYLFPSWMLLPPKPGSGLANMMERAQVEAGLPSPIATHEFWTVPPPDTATTAKDVILSDLTRKRSWRVGPETLATFCAHMAEFKGTHCFHNYTVGREFFDRQTQRFMMALDVRDPKVLDDGTEWISVSIHGQSFMLHQRKMISMAILACRTGTPTRLIPETFGPRRINVPMAPALGLLLEQPVFQTYNEIVTRENAALLLRANLTPEDVAAKVRPPIEFEAHQQQIDAFKVRYIYERMREEEQEKSIFDRWLRYIDSYDGDDLLYLNPKGLILPAAVFGKKGERRVKLLRDWIYERRPEKKSGFQTSEQDEDAEGEDEDAEFAGLKSKDLEEMEG